MFPNLFSSSYEISSKCNAFVQIKDERSEGLGSKSESLNSNNPTLKVPDMWDESVVVKGECEELPNLTVITNHPSQASLVDDIPQTQACDGDSSSSILPREESQNMVAIRLVNFKSPSCNNNCNNTSSDKKSNNFSRGLTPLNIPLTNDRNDDDDESFKVCDYYTRWGFRKCRLLGGGESSLATGTSSWGAPSATQGGGATGGWSGNQSTGGQGSSGTSSQWGNNNRQQPQGQQSTSTPNSAGPTPANNNNTQQQGGGGQQGSGSSSQSQTQTSTSTTSTQSNSQGTNASAAQGGQQGQQSGNQGQVGNTSGGNQQQQTPNNSSGNSGSGNNAGGNNQQGNNNNNSQSGGGSGGGGGGTWGNKSQPGQGGQPTPPTQPTSTKQQMEQLNSMREALFSQDGWGGQNVNQDSYWDIPGSPEPGSKDSGPGAPVPIWKPNVNNVVAGTDLWEANLRNGGMPPPTSQQTQKTPWGHIPTTNIGGTWGEEDEGDASNMWQGVPPTPAPPAQPQWPAQPTQPPPIWPGGGSNKKDGEWGGPNWADQRADPRDMRAPSDMRQMMDHMRPVNIDHRNIGNNEVLMRAEQRGSGRLNGVISDAMWPGGPHHHMHHQGKLPNQQNQPGKPGVNQWSGGGPPIKEMSNIGGGKQTGWEEPSPPAQRRTMPNYDDGTSLWGTAQQNRPSIPGQGKVSHWKDLPSGQSIARGIQCPPGGGSGRGSQMKPEQQIWPHPQRNGGGWGEAAGAMEGGGPCWEEKPAATPWLDQSLAQPWQGKHKPPWDSDMEPSAPWNIHQQKQSSSKLLTKEIIWGSRQFRILTEMGFKKDEVENALRGTSMNLEDALDLLNSTWGPGGSQRRHQDLDPDSHSIVNPFASQQICMYPAAPQPNSRTAQTQQPTAQQLRMLVQQIQMAVQAGYLNNQILNQPLAPQTLILLNQLLQQIKNLQQLQTVVYQSQPNPLKPGNHLLQQTQVKITQTKQQITNLQNQIANQQAVYIKTQQQQQIPPQNDLFRNNMHDPLTALPSNFQELSLKDPPMTASSNQQSRLNQWKLPLLDKEQDLNSGSEFSRAPGTNTTKPAPGNSSPNINPLLSQPDSTWSNRNCETGWPAESNSDDTKDWPSSSQPPAFSDLVPEFEPGKPWKGNSQKTSEDDPSITPGSIVRSPLALPSMKEPHIVSSSSSVQGKASPTSSPSIDILPIPAPFGLAPSTWTFNPSAQPPTSTTSVLSKLNSKSSVAWGGEGGVGGDMWNGASGKVPRGPPPGIPAKPQSTPTSSNGWSPGLNSSTPRWSQPSPAAVAQSSNSQWTPSTWLLLRNLTPQIDGSTLKTLCVQHGPLMSFHLYLSNGIALARYTSREEAQKAQGALNNCVLGNTTIFAENPSESDVLPLVQHLTHGSGGGGGGSGAGSGAGGGSAGGGGGTGWRSGATSASSAPLWSSGSNSSALWPESASSDQHRTTPSSLNSFLPGDLLGGESM